MSAIPTGVERTAELVGMDLDYWVAVTEGLKVVTVVERWGHVVALPDGREQAYSPSTSWLQGGPIIEREGLQLRKFTEWEAGYEVESENNEWIGPHGAGPTHLIAAMRAYVSKRFGETVDDADDPALP
jgi:hypothetical protein